MDASILPVIDYTVSPISVSGLPSQVGDTNPTAGGIDPTQDPITGTNYNYGQPALGGIPRVIAPISRGGLLDSINQTLTGDYAVSPIAVGNPTNGTLTPVQVIYPASSVSSGPEWSSSVPVPSSSGSSLLSNVRGLLVLGALLGAALLFGQSDGSLHVKEYKGADVGTKITNAMGDCHGANPCLLIIDASLASYPAGTTPTLCGTCSLIDYRNGAPGSWLPGIASKQYTIVGIGDSIMSGFGMTKSADNTPSCVTSTGDATCTDFLSQVVLLSALNGHVRAKQNNGVSGTKIAQISTAYDSGAHAISPAVTGNPGIILIEGGANDYAGGTSLATMESGASGLWSKAKADLYTVGAFTIMPRSVSDTYAVPIIDSVRVQYNNWLRAQYQTGAFDYLIDLDSLFPDTSDVNLFQDGTHFTAGGAYSAARYINSVLWGNGIVTPQTRLGANMANGNVVLNFGALSVMNTATASNNTAGGGKALYALTTGGLNTALGYDAGQNITTHSNNTLLGNGAGRVLDSDNNTAVGVNSLLIATSGTGNTALGELAGQSITTANENVVIGHSAGSNGMNTDQNVYIGSSSGGSAPGGLAACVGYASCAASGQGSGNTGIGWGVINTGGSGGGDVAIGYSALVHAGSGANNVGIGNNVLPNPGSGFSDIVIGNAAGTNLTGSGNVSIGDGTGIGITGNSNVVVGYQSGRSLTTGTGSIAIGNTANTSAAATGLVQIGQGTNSTNNTFQFQSWNLFDSNGNTNTNLEKMSVGTAIASAATIAPIARITHITGTTAITTITVPTVVVAGGSYTGCIVLIPDGLWTTGTSGNIALASTAVVSKALQMCYDGTKWYPSY